MGHCYCYERPHINSLPEKLSIYGWLPASERDYRLSYDFQLYWDKVFCFVFLKICILIGGKVTFASSNFWSLWWTVKFYLGRKVQSRDNQFHGTVVDKAFCLALFPVFYFYVPVRIKIILIRTHMWCVTSYSNFIFVQIIFFLESLIQMTNATFCNQNQVRNQI